MTDIPEHLLARSRERRAALGLGGGDAGGGAPTPPAGSAASPEPGGVPAVPAAATVAVPEVVEPVRPDPPYVAASKARPRVPIFVAPVLAMLPVFAFIYWGSLTPKPVAADPVLVEGAAVYADNCAACHMPDGSGGVGRPLNEVVRTFPNEADQIDWVTKGDIGRPTGQPYGVDRVVHGDGYAANMPAFATTLTAEQIAAVVHYERVEFGGESATATTVAGSGTTPTTTK
ncbi:MAG TPA: c-type cytochrome [Acidimicrobiales bacterium]